MAKYRFRLNKKGVSELMKSEEMQAALVEYAKEIRERCGDGYEQDIHVGKRRANAMVHATTYEAKRNNMKNNTLLKAVQQDD